MALVKPLALASGVTAHYHVIKRFTVGPDFGREQCEFEVASYASAEVAQASPELHLARRIYRQNRWQFRDTFGQFLNIPLQPTADSPFAMLPFDTFGRWLYSFIAWYDLVKDPYGFPVLDAEGNYQFQQDPPHALSLAGGEYVSDIPWAQTSEVSGVSLP